MSPEATESCPDNRVSGVLLSGYGVRKTGNVRLPHKEVSGNLACFRGIAGRNNPVAMNAIRLRFLSGRMLPVHFPVCLASGMECFPLSGILLFQAESVPGQQCHEQGGGRQGCADGGDASEFEQVAT